MTEEDVKRDIEIEQDIIEGKVSIGEPEEVLRAFFERAMSRGQIVEWEINERHEDLTKVVFEFRIVTDW